MASAAMRVEQVVGAGAESVEAAVDGAVREVARTLAEGLEGVRALPSALVRRIRTAEAVYHVRGRLMPHDADAAPAIVVVVERRDPEPPSESEIREAFGLTRKESVVARLLAQGRSNTEIAEELFISPHTARHHTENVMSKLGTRTRNSIGEILLDGVAASA